MMPTAVSYCCKALQEEIAKRQAQIEKVGVQSLGPGLGYRVLMKLDFRRAKVCGKGTWTIKQKLCFVKVLYRDGCPKLAALLL